MEVQSYIFAADWNSLERIAKLFKIEFEGKKKLWVAKDAAKKLEEEIHQLIEAEVAPYYIVTCWTEIWCIRI